MSTNVINGQQVDVYIRDVNNYKIAKRKKSPFYCCMPPVGTLVHNQYTNERIATTPDRCLVLSDYKCEQSIMDIYTFLSNFKFEDGNDITTEWLEKRMENDNIPWFKCVYCPPNLEYSACFVPEHLPFSITVGSGALAGKLIGNTPNRKHGKGDFIVCPMANGKPVFQYAKIVNGLDFAAMYNLRGWKDCVMSVSTDTIQRPAPLKNAVYFTETSKTSASEICDSTTMQFLKILETICPQRFWDVSLQNAIKSKDDRLMAYAAESVRLWDDLSSTYNVGVITLMTAWEKGIQKTFDEITVLLAPTYLRNVGNSIKLFSTWKSGYKPWVAQCKWVVDEDECCSVQLDFSMEVPYGIKEPTDKFKFAFSLFPSMESWKCGNADGKVGQYGITGYSELHEDYVKFGWTCEEYLGLQIVPTLLDTAKAFKGGDVHEALTKLERYAKKYAGVLMTCMLQEFRIAVDHDTSGNILLHLPESALKNLVDYYYMPNDFRQVFSPGIYFIAFLQMCLWGRDMGTWNVHTGSPCFIWDKGWVALLERRVRDGSAMEFSVEYSRTADTQPIKVLVGDILIDKKFATAKGVYLCLVAEQVNCFLEKLYKVIGHGVQVVLNG